MSISRWDPWGDIISLREAMSNLLEESFVRPRTGLSNAAAGLAVDLRESGDNYVLTVSVPGVSPDDVHISILGDSLTISGERREERNEEQGGEEGQQRWLIRERRFGRFERSVRLPSVINADQAKAEFKDGVLTITLPKAEEAKPKNIRIHGGTTGTQPAEITDESKSGQQTGASS